MFEMYSLRGSLVIMHDREAGTLMGTFMHASQFKYGWFRHKTGLCVVQKWFMHVLVMHMFVTHASPVKCDLVAHIKHLHVLSVCCRHDYPTNGPTGNPSMVRLP